MKKIDDFFEKGWLFLHLLVCIFDSKFFQALGKMEDILDGACHHGSVLLSLNADG